MMRRNERESCRKTGQIGRCWASCLLKMLRLYYTSHLVMVPSCITRYQFNFEEMARKQITLATIVSGLVMLLVDPNRCGTLRAVGYVSEMGFL